MNNNDTSGLARSNSEKEKTIDPIYDFGSIQENDLKIVQAILDILEKKDNCSISEIKKEIKEQFKIEKIPQMKVENSLWYQFTKDENLGFSIQGHRTTTDENGNKIKIPHIGFSADLDYLDGFIQRILKKGNSLKLLK